MEMIYSGLMGGMGLLAMLGSVAAVAGKIIFVFVLIKAYVALDVYIKKNR